MSEVNTNAESRRGRPRPQDTIKRDESVLQVLKDKGPMTRDEAATALGVKSSHVYLSLIRLRRDGLAVRGEGDTAGKWAVSK